jgi:hypothetical protein
VRVHNWTADAANSLDINATEMDQEDNGFAAGLSNAVTRDGQGKMTVDFLPNADNTLNLGSGALRWASINGLPINSITSGIYYARTPTEITAGVTPTDYTKLGLPNVIDVARYGADATGATDSTTAFTNAMAGLGTAGGIVYFRGAFLIDNNLTIPDNVMLVGYELNPGQRTDGNYAPTNFASTLIVNTTKTITHNNRCGVRNCLIIAKVLSPLGAYPMPFANATVAQNAVNAFAGTLFTPAATTCDFRLEDVLCLGFATLYDGTGATSLNRPFFRRVYGDCTSGIKVANVFDIGRAESCEMWPFTTTNQSFTTNALLVRTGTAFYTTSGSTWMKWEDCFEYGWQTGFDVNGVQDVRLVSCGADGPSSNQPGSGCLGFYLRGSMANCVLINPQTTQQADAGIRINTTAQNNVNTVQIIGHVAHGNNSSNGYVDVQSGNYSIASPVYIDNSSVGHVKLEAGAGSGTIIAPMFNNGGSNPPIFGDSGAVSRCTVIGDNYMNMTGLSPGSLTGASTWTPTLNFGGATTGITYSAQLGRYTKIGKMVECEFKIILTSKGSATGNATISGLPYTSGNTAGASGGCICHYYQNMASLTAAPVMFVQEGATTVNVQNQGTGGTTNLTDANFTNTSTLYGRIRYTTS